MERGAELNGTDQRMIGYGNQTTVAAFDDCFRLMALRPTLSSSLPFRILKNNFYPLKV